MDSVPIGLLFACVIIVVALAIELGYRLGNTHSEQAKKEKEKITSHNSSAILGMLGFILVFTFGIVYSRYDSKKELVREEANAIRSAWLRSDFIPEQSRMETKALLKKYLDQRINLVTHDLNAEEVDKILIESTNLQYQIWDIANKSKNEINSHLGALYVESLNEMFNVQALRIAVGMQSRVPNLIYVMLFSLVILGMFSFGYNVSVSGAGRRSWITPVMILTFSLVVTIITALDRPNISVLQVTQQPLKDVRVYMDDLNKGPLTP